MKLSDLEIAPDLILPEHSVLYRIQRRRPRRGAVPIGPIRVPQRGGLIGRFDVVTDEVGYFAESPETAIYETLARREATHLSQSELRRRVLLVLHTVRPLRLLDLRQHANAYPVLQSLRFHVTQEISADAYGAGYEGIVYQSAQQYGCDCFSLNSNAMRGLRLASKKLLIEPGTGALHRALALAIRGSQIAVVP
jgi:hypothetical protein